MTTTLETSANPLISSDRVEGTNVYNNRKTAMWST